MEHDVFVAWLDGIGSLTAEQRGQGFRALALAEAANNGHSVSVAFVPGAAFPASPITWPQDRPLGGTPVLTETGTSAVSRSDAVSLVAAAQSKVDLTGCPHCGGRSLQRWGQVSGLQRYRCGDCRRSFNALTGTPLARLRMKDRWQAQTEALITGESLAKTAKRCGIASTTAFRWRHRFLSAPALDKPSQLTGIVEADETFILESFKGKRAGLPRPARKRGGKASKRGLSSEQIPVIVARDRTGATLDAVLPRLDAASMTAALGNTITRPAELCCDGGSAITAFARRARIKFHVLPAPGLAQPEAPAFQ